MAGLVAVDAAVRCADGLIQVLGGIGYTWEHEAHLYYRRAMSLRALLGPSDDAAARVADLAMARVRQTVTLEISDDDETARAEVRAELARVAAASGAGADAAAGRGRVGAAAPAAAVGARRAARWSS